MSFILEALKKSENKNRKENGQLPRSIHEPVSKKNSRSRTWILGFFLLLIVNAAVLLWFFGPWHPPSLAPTDKKPLEESVVNRSPVTKLSTSGKVALTTQNSNSSSSVDRQQPAKTVSTQVVGGSPVPQNENKIYTFGQLPTLIQKRIPVLKMSLHAYNRDNGSASMVQLNDKILREGEMVTDKIRLEQITAAGVVLYYDGYRFLLPRRGN